MALYVVALTDSAVPDRKGGHRQLETLPVARGIYAVYERRAEPPEPSDTELRAQHALVVELSAQAEAILPVRFGTLLTAAELRRTLRSHRDEIHAALNEVRGRTQMTVRVMGPSTPAQRPSAISGREYMELKRSAAGIPLPRQAERLFDALRPLVARERRERGAGGLLATVYHLVGRNDVRTYQRTASRFSSGRLLVSGPWPPFAFTPRLS